MNYTARDSRPTWEPKPYSEGQAKLIKAMCTERGITAQQLMAVFPKRPATFQDGRKVIEWLKAQPKEQASTAAAPATPSSPQVRDGYYAITEGYDKPHFFRVKNGRKAGVVFMDEQASDQLFPVRNHTRRTEILRIIAKDPAKAQALYGELIGRCANCHRVLTDHKNPYFHMGLGPECGSK